MILAFALSADYPHLRSKLAATFNMCSFDPLRYNALPYAAPRTPEEKAKIDPEGRGWPMKNMIGPFYMVPQKPYKNGPRT